MIPKIATGMTTENTIMLRHPFFIGAHYQTGPSVLHLAKLNYKQVYPQIVTEWELPLNCSLFLFIPIGKTYEQHRDFSVLQDARFPSFSAWISENRKPVKFYWFEKDAKFLSEMEPGTQRDEHTFLGHDSFIDLYLIDGKRQKSISRDAANEWCRGENINEARKECIAGYEAEYVTYIG